MLNLTSRDDNESGNDTGSQMQERSFIRDDNGSKVIKGIDAVVRAVDPGVDGDLQGHERVVQTPYRVLLCYRVQHVGRAKEHIVAELVSLRAVEEGEEEILGLHIHA